MTVRHPSTVLSTTVVTAAAWSVSRKVQGRASSAVPWFASLLLCMFSFPVICISVLFSAIFPRVLFTLDFSVFCYSFLNIGFHFKLEQLMSF